MPRIYIAVTTDWEGAHFRNLKELRKIRQEMGWELPVTHFICPAYFTRQMPEDKAARIQEAMGRYDETALHIHCYQSLVQQACVAFRSSPNYYRGQAPLLRKLASIFQKNPTNGVSGRGVPLSAYNHEEIKKIVLTSGRLLEEALGQKVVSFRAGGWIANDAVFQVLTEAGFTLDSSAVPPAVLSQGYRCSNNGNGRDDHGETNGTFTNFITNLWGCHEQQEGFLKNSMIRQSLHENFITRYKQPWRINGLPELPSNGALSDFASIKRTMRPLLNHGLKQAKQHHKDFFMSIGMHQEGPLEWKVPLLEFVRSITPEERKYIRFVTMKQAAAIFGEQV